MGRDRGAGVLVVLMLQILYDEQVHAQFVCGQFARDSQSAQGLMSDVPTDHHSCLEYVKLISDHFTDKISYMCGAQPDGMGFYLVSESQETCYKAARGLTQRVKHGAKFSCHISKPIFLSDCPRKIGYFNNFVNKLKREAEAANNGASDSETGELQSIGDDAMSIHPHGDVDTDITWPTLLSDKDPCLIFRCSMDCEGTAQAAADIIEAEAEAEGQENSFEDLPHTYCGWDIRGRNCRAGLRSTNVIQEALHETSQGDCGHHLDMHYGEGSGFGGANDDSSSLRERVMIDKPQEQQEGNNYFLLKEVLGLVVVLLAAYQQYWDIVL